MSNAADGTVVDTPDGDEYNVWSGDEMTNNGNCACFKDDSDGSKIMYFSEGCQSPKKPFFCEFLCTADGAAEGCGAAVEYSADQPEDVQCCNPDGGQHQDQQHRCETI